jgi:hypothetical protein
MPDKGKKGKKPRKDKDKRKGDKKHKQGKGAAKVSGSAAKDHSAERGKTRKKGKGGKRKTDAAAIARAIIDPGQRVRMIAVAAYYRSLARGHDSGSPEQDWAEAEREIEQQYPSQDGSAG